MRITLKLSDNLYQSERQIYTIFTMISDMGGFNSAVTLLPAFLLSIYSSQMYAASLKSEIPVRRQASSTSGAAASKQPQINRLFGGFGAVREDQESQIAAASSSSQERLSLKDVQSIYDLMESTQTKHCSYLASFRSLVSFCCCRSGVSRKKLFRNKASERFEEKLDIRSFVSVSRNLALLMKSLLTNKQLLLF